MVVAQGSGTPPVPDGTPNTRGDTGKVREWVWLAHLRRPQGRKGELYAEILTDFPEKFAERKRLWLLEEKPSSRPETRSSAQPRQVVLADHWMHKGGIVLHFEGVTSISEAEQLAGLIVAIPSEERAALAEDEAYIGDLMGCTVVDMARSEPVAVGEIEGVDRTAGPVPLLIVRATAAGRSDEILIPFAKSYLRSIDLAAKRVEMELPVGLVDLNEAEEA